MAKISTFQVLKTVVTGTSLVILCGLVSGPAAAASVVKMIAITSLIVGNVERRSAPSS